MKKIQLIILFSLFILWGFWFQIKKDDIHVGVAEQNIAGEKIEDTNLNITFLDIGQGDATLLTFPDGTQMLVDCAIDGRILEALGRVMSFSDKTIDYLVVSHPDLDHYGGCVDVMETFDVKEVWYTGLKKEYDTMWQEFWYHINDGSHVYKQISHAEQIEIASTTIDILYPDHNIDRDDKIPGETKASNANNTSIVMNVSYDGVSTLLTADAEEELESYLLTTYGELLQSDILKMGHHGSDSSSMLSFVEMVAPRDAVASAGVDNKFGHPSRRVLKRFERLHSHIWRTDVHGDITATIHDGIYMINTQYNNQ